MIEQQRCEDCGTGHQEGAGMSDNGGGGDIGTKAMVAVAAFGATFITRKALIFGWTKITGKEPPNEHDSSASWATALGWAMVMGVGIQAARMAASRAVMSRMRPPAADEISD
jgi:hypothetical protein